MPVYEATELRHYERIALFIKNQIPTELEKFLPFICWQRGFDGKGHLAEFVKRLKERMVSLHIFWAEDDEGEIRVVLSVQERMTEQKIAIATHAFVIVRRDDWDNNDGTYFKELLDHIIRFEAPKYKLEKGDFFGMKKYADWTKELCGETMTVIKDHDTDLGRVYRYEIDFIGYGKKCLL